MPNFTTPSSAGRHRHRRLDFAAINCAALARLPELVARLLPGGRRIGREWTCGSLAGEPGRSCRVNLATGRWADFATGEKGGDVIALAAAVWRVSQGEAARRLAALLGVEACRHG
jgi:putative DNA primase/helicase